MPRCLEKSTAWERASKVTQSCPTLGNPIDCSLPVSSIHGIFQARVQEWVALSFFRGSSWPSDQTSVSRIADRRFTVWATMELTKEYRSSDKSENCRTGIMGHKEKFWRRLQRRWAPILVLPGTTCPIFPFKNQLLIELGSSYLKFERHAEFDQDKSEQKYIEKSVHNREMKRGKDRTVRVGRWSLSEGWGWGMGRRRDWDTWKRASLLVQWLRLCLPVQGVQVWSLVRDLRSTCFSAKKPKHKTEATL